MKITYNNAPCNKQRITNAPMKTIIIMSCVVVIMVAVKVFYAPTDSLEDAAAMAGISGETLDSESTTEGSDTADTQSTAEKAGVGATAQEQSYTDVSYTAKEATYESVCPIDGEITSAFAQRENPFDASENEFHKGVDIAPIDNEHCGIAAFRTGCVEKTGNSPSYGNYLILRHSNTLQTLYAHCSEIYVSEGEDVSCGQLIAKAGQSGAATGVHLHFEVRINGVCVDPMNFL